MARYYLPLTTISFEHNYYASSKCGDLVVTPTEETAAKLPKYRLRWGVVNRKRPESYQLLQENVEVTPPPAQTFAPLVPLPANYVLRFEMALTNSNFMNFTDFNGQPAKSGQEIYYFENQPIVGSPPLPHALTASGLYDKMELTAGMLNITGLSGSVTIAVAPAGGATLFSVSSYQEGASWVARVNLEGHSPGVYVLTWGANTKRVYLDPNLVGKNLFGVLHLINGSPRTVASQYLHPFVAKRVTWKYYVLPKGGIGAGVSYSISSANPTFGAGTVVTAPVADPVLNAAMVAGGFQKAVVFASNGTSTLISYSEVARSSIALTRTSGTTTKTLVSNLPNPAVGNPSACVFVTVDALLP